MALIKKTIPTFGKDRAPETLILSWWEYKKNTTLLKNNMEVSYTGLIKDLGIPFSKFLTKRNENKLS